MFAFYPLLQFYFLLSQLTVYIFVQHNRFMYNYYKKTIVLYYVIIIVPCY